MAEVMKTDVTDTGKAKVRKTEAEWRALLTPEDRKSVV